MSIVKLQVIMAWHEPEVSTAHVCSFGCCRKRLALHRSNGTAPEKQTSSKTSHLCRHITQAKAIDNPKSKSLIQCLQRKTKPIHSPHMHQTRPLYTTAPLLRRGAYYRCPEDILHQKQTSQGAPSVSPPAKLHNGARKRRSIWPPNPVAPGPWTTQSPRGLRQRGLSAGDCAWRASR